MWTLSAEQDRADIVDFIAQDNPLAAIRMDETFSTAVGRLAEHPLPSGTCSWGGLSPAMR